MNRLISLITPLVLGAIALVPAPTPAQTVPRLQQGQPYTQVRQTVTAEGWQPAASNARSPQNLNGFESYIVNTLGYREMKSCAGTGLGACRFEFTSGGRTLVLITAGEEPRLERWWVE